MLGLVLGSCLVASAFLLLVRCGTNVHTKVEEAGGEGTVRTGPVNFKLLKS